MKNTKGTIIFASILCISVIMALFQYRREQESNTHYYESEIVISGEDEDSYDITKAYYENYDDSGLETYIIMGVYDETESYISNARREGKCEYIFENEQGQIIVKVTSEQRKCWIDEAVSVIETVMEDISDEDLYIFEFSNDYTELYSEVSEKSNGYDYAADLILLLYSAEIYQIFNGVEDWSIHVVVENMDNGA